MRPIARWLDPSARLLGAGCLSALAVCSGGAAHSAEMLAFRNDPPCVLDKCLKGGIPTPSTEASQGAGESFQRRNPNTGFGRPPASGSFDFYVLALSWSPGFCETGGAEKAEQQCEPGNRLGFVVHGLWPQNNRGYPSDCNPTAGAPSRIALESVRGVYPDEGLARYEWRKHGTCTGLSPTDYFAEVRRARDAVVVPDAFKAPADPQNWAPLDIARAFVGANPRLRTDAMAVTCRGNTLEEVRVCLSKDLRGFVSCPEVARASCRRPIEVPPVL